MGKTLNRWERVKRSVERIERGLRADFTLSQCADYVEWVAKFHKVSRDEWIPVCEKITELFENEY